jgi:WD40 repeat protein
MKHIKTKSSLCSLLVSRSFVVSCAIIILTHFASCTFSSQLIDEYRGNEHTEQNVTKGVTQTDKYDTSETTGVSTSLTSEKDLLCQQPGCQLISLGSQQFLAFSPSGNKIIWAEKGGKLAPKAAFPKTASKVQAPENYLGVVSSSGRLLAVSNDREITISYFNNFKIFRELKEFKTKVSSLAFAPDERSLLIGGKDGRIYLWRYTEESSWENYFLSSMPTIDRYISHNAPISAVTFHPSGKSFISADWSGVIMGWKAYEDDKRGKRDFLSDTLFTSLATKVRFDRAQTSSVDKLFIPQDGESLIIVNGEGGIEVWRISGKKKEVEFADKHGVILNASFDPINKKLVTLGRGGVVRKLAIETPRDSAWQVKSLAELTDQSIQALVMLSDGQIAAADRTGHVSLLTFDGENGNVR